MATRSDRQVVRVDMAVEAVRELVGQALPVRLLMALAAGRHGPVVALVTAAAGQPGVFAFPGAQGLDNFIMAGGTGDRRHLGSHLNRSRLVCLVAGRAVGIGHGRFVRLVAEQTFGDGPMLFLVTAAA